MATIFCMLGFHPGVIYLAPSDFIKTEATINYLVGIHPKDEEVVTFSFPIKLVAGGAKSDYPAPRPHIKVIVRENKAISGVYCNTFDGEEPISYEPLEYYKDLDIYFDDNFIWDACYGGKEADKLEVWDKILRKMTPEAVRMLKERMVENIQKSVKEGTMKEYEVNPVMDITVGGTLYTPVGHEEFVERSLRLYKENG